uniref:Small ribosomal subunit protein uS3m n=1 Tax=Asterophora parasitica TaxID=117018 RepID=A0A386TXW2_9AGAR|nr:ribosomal protein S3 [Asterophora parasitica]AYE93053.1 ribosomal protein S3 [Asterophora parasitica]
MTNLTNLNTNTTNKIIITRNEYSDIKLDTRIIPLFSSPVYLKEKSLKKRNKYNFNLLNSQKKLTSKVISFKEILSLFLKGFNVYNLNLNNYLLQHKKLDLREYLLLQSVGESKGSTSLPSNISNAISNMPQDSYPADPADPAKPAGPAEGRIAENYNLNLDLNNYLFSLNRFMPVLRYRSFIYKASLFFPAQIFKPKLFIGTSYRLSYLQKFFKLLSKDALLKYLVSKPLILENSIIPYSPAETIKTNKKKKKSIIPGHTIKGSLLDLYIKKHKKLRRTQKKIIIHFIDRGENLVKELNLLINKKQILINNLLNNTTNINKPLLPAGSFGSLGQVANVNKNQIISDKESILNKHSYSNPISLFYYSSNDNTTQFKYNLINNNLINTNIENKPVLNQYLKEMSIYNMSRKGIFIYYSNLIGFNFNKGNNKLYKNIYKLLAASFKSMYCLISKPVFTITPDKIIIHLFYYLFIPNILKLKKLYKYSSNKNLFKGRNWFNRKKKIKKQYSKFRKIKLNTRIKLRNLSNLTLTKVFPNKFKELCLILNKLFKKPVEFDLIRLHYPYNDSNILVNLLGIMINKIKLRIIVRRLFEKAVIKNLNKLNGNKINIIPAFLSGITIRVAGRLLTHKVVPRQTVKTTRRGASAKGKINFKDVATYTNKNKRGAFSITVKSGQNFF